MERDRGNRVAVNPRTSGGRSAQGVRDDSRGMKLPRRWFQLVYAVLMSTMMAFWMTLIVTFVNIGLVDDFFRRWLRAFGIAYLFALPLTFLLNPLSRKLTARIVASDDD